MTTQPPTKLDIENVVDMAAECEWDASDLADYFDNLDDADFRKYYGRADREQLVAAATAILNEQ